MRSTFISPRDVAVPAWQDTCTEDCQHAQGKVVKVGDAWGPCSAPLHRLSKALPDPGGLTGHRMGPPLPLGAQGTLEFESKCTQP